jgi:hypothetical protein
MTTHADNLFILVLADDTSAISAVADAHGSVVKQAATLMDALGMYIMLMPHTVILDADHAHAADVLMHLRTVDAPAIVIAVNQSTPPPWMSCIDLSSVHNVRVIRHATAERVYSAARSAAAGLRSVRMRDRFSAPSAMRSPMRSPR